jgi:hypothetical protein
MTAQSAATKKPDYSHGKQLAQQIFHDTMAAINVRHAMLAKLKFEGGALMAGEVAHPLVRPPRVVAFGKAANRMATVLHEILGGKIEAGVSVAPAGTPKEARELPLFCRRPSLSQYRQPGGRARRTGTRLPSDARRHGYLSGFRRRFRHPGATDGPEHHARRFEGVQPRAGDLPPSHRAD